MENNVEVLRIMKYGLMEDHAKCFVNNYVGYVNKSPCYECPYEVMCDQVYTLEDMRLKFKINKGVSSGSNKSKQVYT